jgi:hypothetical protein
MIGAGAMLYGIATCSGVAAVRILFGRPSVLTAEANSTIAATISGAR